MTSLKYVRFFHVEKKSSDELFAHSCIVTDPVFCRQILCCSTYESCRQVSLIQKRAIELFEGDVDAAMEWMNRSNRALSWHKPLDLTTSEKGIAQVLSLITRIEHGIFS